MKIIMEKGLSLPCSQYKRCSRGGYTCDKRWVFSKNPKMVVQDMHMTKDGAFPKFQKLLYKESATYTFSKGFCRPQKVDL